jgi:hypothetical protein
MLRGLNLQMLAFEQLLPGQVLVIGHLLQQKQLLPSPYIQRTYWKVRP